MKIAFTGTQAGVTKPQATAFREWWGIDPVGHEVHYGCCVGADAQVAAFLNRQSPRPRLIAHPGDNPGKTDQAAVAVADVAHPARPNLDRNRDMVDAAEILLACPQGPEEQRSGTWATVRYARSVGIPIVLFWPDGRTTDEPGRGRVKQLRCPGCDELTLKLRWQHFRNGTRHIRADCPVCDRYVGFAEQTPGNVAEADRTTPYNEPPAR